MKKFNSSLLLIASLMGLFLAGCNQKPASLSPTTKDTSGAINIQNAPATQNATGSISIAPTETITSDGATKKAVVTVEDVTSNAEAMEQANKALEAAAADKAAAEASTLVE